MVWHELANLHSVLVRWADSTRLGSVALSVLYEPRTSISMTDLKAFVLSWLIGARKFPAAPALLFINTESPRIIET